ncbi:hypothetical protein KP509_20G059300 [Ceratopteris richardii]|uniref:SHSP domain-containing protein n=1 Tax=Ceratopteris richardii TaxID=49495 RepID=A0A8T2SJ68_CERRI|nr:hypothetical protein KP509_20G059300 [Ceratopteris richardii]KAH7331943.1 hypothetical protein KP509_20G059300 [Ceratopteris richardii]
MDLSESANPEIFADRMLIDWREEPYEHVFEVSLPGVSPQNIQLRIMEEGKMEISAQRVDMTTREESWRHVESIRGFLLRRFTLPEDGMISLLKTEVRDGILKITYPKMARYSMLDLNRLPRTT